MPSAVHDELVDALAALAVLTGHGTPLRSLPDGRVSDVLAFDLSAHRLFCADAKATQSPRDRQALARLESYVAWLAAARRWRSIVLAVACSDPDYVAA